jgi:hypothetical protein
MQQVGEIPDATEGEIRESIEAYARSDRILTPYKRMLDIWTSQHFSHGEAEKFLSMTVSTVDVEHLMEGHYAHFSGPSKKTIDTAIDLADDKHFFHWEMEFPEVFYEGTHERKNPGFDVIVGNPPYVSAWSMTSVDTNLRATIAAVTQAGDALRGHWDLYVVFLLKAFRRLVNTRLC